MEQDLQEGEENIGEFFLSEEDMYRLYQEEYGDSSAAKQCAYGTAESIYQQLSQLVLLALLSRCTKIIPLPTALRSLLNIGLGIYALRTNVGDERLFATVLALSLSLSLFTRLLRGSAKGVLVTAIGILTIVMLEYHVEEVSVVRGVLMVLVMKISSLAFDSTTSQEAPGLVPSMAYLLDPSTVIFGPFIRFEEYKQAEIFVSIATEVKFLLRSTFCLLAALVCVTYSSCHSEVVPVNDYTSDYLTAQSFRFSHYFICLFSQALWHISGGSGYVTNPLPIELPRSLVDVVVVWNVPMHKYLRKYVFGSAKGLGSGAAVFLTFLVSSLLHGLNFQLSAVLTSLGLLCYGENALRNRLSIRFSACIRSKACATCNHIQKSRSPTVILFNLLFSVLSIYHLIYLGMPFDGHSSAEHVLSVWSRHSYASHLIALVYLLLSKTI